MTLHVVYNHQCSGCGAYYIPYDLVACPQCGRQETERFDYIPQAVMSLQFNKRTYGSYRPPAWWVGSLGDHILHLLFGIFDAYDADDERGSFESFLEAYLDKIVWKDQKYLKSHLNQIALRIRPALDREEITPENQEGTKRRTVSSEEERSAWEERRRLEREERARSPWGDSVCAGCGRKLSTWADNKLGRCGFCRRPLEKPPET